VYWYVTRVTTFRSNQLARVRWVIWQAVLWNLENKDNDLKSSAENKNMERGSNLKILEDENTDTDTKSHSDTGYTAKPKKGSPEKSNKEAPPKETDLDTILYAPVKKGRPQNQKDITDFFLRELALRKKKLEDSSSRRREKGSDWYSKLRKTPERIKEEKIRLRRVCDNISIRG
jgi:hypothetical protein